MDMGIWVVGTSHQPFTRGSSTEKKKIQKKNCYWQKSSLCDRSILHSLASDIAVFHGNDMFSILVLSTKKRYSNLLSKVFFFQKICFKVKVLKMLKISTDYNIKTCRTRKLGTILKITSIVY